MSEPLLICRSAADGRYIAGLAVPWDTEITHRGQRESFAPGSLRADSGVVLMRYGHLGTPSAMPVPIGEVVDTADTGDGLWAEARIADGPLSDQAYAAAAAGLVRGLSVEFRTRAHGRARDGRDRGQGRITDAVMVGLVLTEQPAYAAARVTQVRAATPRLDAWRGWYRRCGDGEATT